MGALSVNATPGEDLDVELTIQDDDENSGTYWAEVFADKVVGGGASASVNLVGTYGPLTVTNNSASPTTFELPDLPFDEDWDYLYVKVSQGPESSPKQQAFLAPVWFN
jgi:hypothetical protein